MADYITKLHINRDAALHCFEKPIPGSWMLCTVCKLPAPVSFSSTEDVSFLLKTFWSLPISTSKSFCLGLDLLMENSASGSFLRNRRLESFLETKSGPNVRETQKIPSKQVITRQRPNKTDAFVDDDGWIPTLISCVRIVTCYLAMMVTTFIWAIIMLMLLPWPSQRVRQGNIYGHVTGRLLIIWYPLFGQLYVLANHLRIDRSDPSTAIKSMEKAVQAVKKHGLSLIIFPEGTRSKNGRLLPFKKGFVHLAIESGLPIVPIILTGTHLAWRKGSLHVRPAPISVKYLPPIKTDSWTADSINDYIKMVHDIYVENLPEAQKPISTDDTKNSSRS
ncbi:hypothetical protein Gogos_020854 [Gossypium gossypioides]|uniref:Phospholipid/glycerol acyltransferase domain-containing protein n=1 Tax=Gossypium gossypioides TaxID=34282 RepID=A0A7J9D5V9_GOSGO|nr:hypothetical protein [Gossypium gossypioides]